MASGGLPKDRGVVWRAHGHHPRLHRRRVAEIAGCFAYWIWRRPDQTVWWLVPGMLSLAAFGYLLTLEDSDAAERASAACSGVYIDASLFWLWAVERRRPDHWDLVGAPSALLTRRSYSGRRARPDRRPLPH
ncbi:YnfA family protein [Dankookia sp. P2]|uniref:YnfA family protein n=1 Tax=Dankookia sp. P2 TaxID=3423955 RepID=UPI003D668B1A